MPSNDARSPRSPSGARMLTVGVASVVVLALAGCGGSGNGRDRDPARDETVIDAGLPPIENDEGPRGYREVVSGSLALLQDYWGAELAAEGEDDRPPAALVSYWNRSQDKRCGGYRTGPGNAQYCAPSDTISWDGNWLYGDLYRKAGDAAVAFLLAHEYGHLVQKRLGIANEFELTIEAELNADCLAGAWFGAVDEDVARLDDADFDALYVAVLDVADPRGLPWQDPEAHGTANERGDALLHGGEGGPRGCFRRYGPGFTR